ncbi:helix-turn-helix domain-containing protein [Desertimonas flava]|uniref:helix-turn-helix domain-containing protein n=1 Tax=Desertimonas flava TaxID=2064846 RepID=UPI001D0CAF29|nr:helix-turn-helix domain-containing protein [Desertimonas flava]
MDDAAGASDPGHHVVVVGRSDMNRRYQIVRRGGARSWLLTWTMNGAGELAHDDVQTVSGPGDLVVLAPDVNQRYRTAGDRWDFLWAHFHAHPAWPPLLRTFELGRGLFRMHIAGLEDRARVTAAFDRASRDARPDAVSLVEPLTRLDDPSADGTERVRAGGPESADLLLNAIEEVVLVAVRAGRTTGERSDADGILAARRAIASDPAAPHTVASLAAVAAMSPSHFAHQFRRRIGTTPMAALRDERLALAVQLLRSTDMSIAQVARAVGYRDPLYFSRVVHRTLGAAPSDLADAERRTRCQDKLR